MTLELSVAGWKPLVFFVVVYNSNDDLDNINITPSSRASHAFGLSRY